MATVIVKGFIHRIGAGALNLSDALKDLGLSDRLQSYH